ncbi:MAG: histidine phosphatase family protein, partial [Bacteroidetes bacterium]|nr:histidine phosphatase family protein [Bacteroidota bacterium]
AYDKKHRDIQLIPDLYNATLDVFRTVVTDLDDADGSVALFSHNPGITAFANILSTVRLDNMPTCAIFAVKAETDHWRDFLSSSPQFWFFDYPKAGGHD